MTNPYARRLTQYARFRVNVPMGESGSAAVGWYQGSKLARKVGGHYGSSSVNAPGVRSAQASFSEKTVKCPVPGPGAPPSRRVKRLRYSAAGVQLLLGYDLAPRTPPLALHSVRTVTFSRSAAFTQLVVPLGRHEVERHYATPAGPGYSPVRHSSS